MHGHFIPQMERVCGLYRPPIQPDIIAAAARTMERRGQTSPTGPIRGANWDKANIGGTPVRSNS